MGLPCGATWPFILPPILNLHCCGHHRQCCLVSWLAVWGDRVLHVVKDDRQPLARGRGLKTTYVRLLNRMFILRVPGVALGTEVLGMDPGMTFVHSGQAVCLLGHHLAGTKG